MTWLTFGTSKRARTYHWNWNIPGSSRYVLQHFCLLVGFLCERGTNFTHLEDLGIKTLGCSVAGTGSALCLPRFPWTLSLSESHMNHFGLPCRRWPRLRTWLYNHECHEQWKKTRNKETHSKKCSERTENLYAWFHRFHHLQTLRDAGIHAMFFPTNASCVPSVCLLLYLLGFWVVPARHGLAFLFGSQSGLTYLY